jgi:hypothetical protein
MSVKAILRPSPVFIIALANRKADTISHVVLLAMPYKASFGLRTLAVTVKVRLMKAIAPIGSGWTMKLITVMTNIVKSVHACGLRPSGTGINYMIIPSRTIKIPCINSPFTAIPPPDILRINWTRKLSTDLKQMDHSPSFQTSAKYGNPTSIKTLQRLLR